MVISASRRGHLKVAAVVLAGGAAVIGLLAPAVSRDVRPYVRALSIISCMSGGPCEEGNNAGTGPGVEGISAQGSGLVGLTTFNSTSPANGQAGTLGQDASTSGSFNAGVKGTSAKGIGVVGTSTSNNGVAGMTTHGIGVRGDSSSGAGVYGKSKKNAGVEGFSTNGIGASGTSANYVGVFAMGGMVQNGFLYPSLSVTGNATNPDLIYACRYNGGQNVPCSVVPGGVAPDFAVINNGNVFITGQIFTSGPCSSGCVASPSGGEKRVRFFTPQESLPTIEDFGQAQLVGGRTYVRIDPAFANTVDSHAAYMVFITPEGDNRGLYITNKTPAGFEVRESQAGQPSPLTIASSPSRSGNTPRGCK